MNVKKMFLVIVAVFSMVAFFGVNAYAGSWYVCKVKMAGTGSSGNNTYIRLTDAKASPDFTYRWFTAYSNLKKEMLATALAAMSNDKLVYAYLSATSEYSHITALYMETGVATGAIVSDMDIMDMDMPE